MQLKHENGKLKLEKKTIALITGQPADSRNNFTSGPNTLLPDAPSLAEICTTTISWTA